YGSEPAAWPVALLEEAIHVIGPHETDLFAHRADRGRRILTQILMGDETPLGMPLERFRDHVREESNVPGDPSHLGCAVTRTFNPERLDIPRHDGGAGREVEKGDMELPPARHHVERIPLHRYDPGLV